MTFRVYIGVPAMPSGFPLYLCSLHFRLTQKNPVGCWLLTVVGPSSQRMPLQSLTRQALLRRSRNPINRRIPVISHKACVIAHNPRLHFAAKAPWTASVFRDFFMICDIFRLFSAHNCLFSGVKPSFLRVFFKGNEIFSECNHLNYSS